MAQGTSLHIGLNTVDPAAYHNATPLSGCINDANDMQRIALAQGFQTHCITNESATAAAVIDMLSLSASRMCAGDLMLITYSGHGGSIIDRTGDEDDGRDETWCLYDRMLLDDELGAIWAQFARGVRILVLSDSCHSGTVLRQLRVPTPGLDLPPPAPVIRSIAPMLVPPLVKTTPLVSPRALRGMVEAASRSIRSRAAARRIVARAMPPEATLSALEADPGIYTTVRALTRARRDQAIEASVILISGCRDDQLSADGDNNGLFTEKLLEVWADSAFEGDHDEFHREILARMPDDQSPELMVLGPDDASFRGQKPFTITTNAANEPVTSALWVRGPDHVPADGPPPVFDVNPGPNRYYIFEIASDPSLFDTAMAQADRDETNFYGSWSDSAHLSGASYRLPQAVWDRLRAADRLYYRIGSTANAQGWDNYMVSTADQQPGLAPFLTLDPAAEEPAIPDTPAAGGPTIFGPGSLSADGGPPTFQVNTAGAPYYVVEVATQPFLFDTVSAEADRDASSFYGSWSDSALLTDARYTLPDRIWQRLDRSGGLLYYRAGTTRSAQWDDYRVTTPDSQSDSAPFILLS